MITLDPTNIIIASIGIIPGVLAYLSSRKTRRSVQLAGSDVTINTWNKLIENLYEEIERLTQQNAAERRRAEAKEARLNDDLTATRLELEMTRQEAEAFMKKAQEEKLKLLHRIEELGEELEKLKRQINATIKGVPNG